MKENCLVIVESPAKAKTIRRFLGKNYQVKASMGHLIDLPRSQFGIDVKNDFKPKYITIRGKGEILKSLKEARKKADRVFLAADPDREGEAICWHLSNALELGDSPNRIEFNEITKNKVKDAVKNPRYIDHNRVEAQQARRILDRIVGYQISPLLWRKVKKGLSAGRVQSVAVRLICDREKEIKDFKPEEYWTIDADLKKENQEVFKARLIRYQNKKVKLPARGETDKALEYLKKQNYVVKEVNKKQRERKPSAPFTTSSLQQEASQQLSFNTGKTMRVAQQLYEGINLGSGEEGLITYIRTDSVRVSETAVNECLELIERKFGKDFRPSTPHKYTSKKGQDAHEAIRPTSVAREPEEIKSKLSSDQYRLYKLIWNRFVSSQMSPAVIDQVRADIEAGEYTFRATGSQVKFPGFLMLYSDKKRSDGSEMLPRLSENEALEMTELHPEQHFTQPPPRYNEASLVKILEKKGIGRPSTYSPIIETIQARGYVVKEGRAFMPTELGGIVVDLLRDFFPDVVDVEFTARLEEKLDYVEEGKINGTDVLKEFYSSFEKHLKNAEEKMKKVEVEETESEEICPHCGKNLVYKHGRFGRFLACPGFPDCKYTKNIKQETGVKCPKDDGDLVVRKTKKGRVFYGCSNYPDCDYSIWQKPLTENCPECGHFLVAGRGKNGKKECGSSECSYSEKTETVKSGRGG